ncbi:NAD(P)/FAD-dependent oxidoreductase [Campylobacter gastrosuis]|uniref:Aminoacetone oxidase family FAD-binding enzyme n=1 Tax=Campylobacter gastrosuis TaxID=2974576 RepID=A0ABT7HR50_9BACT|nr:aminoacetone oxidase family FAD-binding enzyme [Campylobacter gastrosuis]MDL0089392.1 aminoacetone oxidase family FAD-binding enzyme [Campylobacter gastrosuis]
MYNFAMKIYKNLIIGGGASGLFLATLLDKNETIILEKNSKFGAKILASGGGRCNITNQNISTKNYLGDENFVREILGVLSYEEVLRNFKNLDFSKEKDAQFYCKNGSKAVLNEILRKVKCEFRLNCEVKTAQKEGDLFKISTNLGEFFARNLIVASGGLSYKALGASGVGYEIARHFSHDIATPSPALVGFSVQKDEFWFKNISGVSINCKIKVAGREFCGNVLFTHRGISGPAVLNASLFWQKGKISINFAPHLKAKNFTNTKKQVSTILGLPKSFCREFLTALNLADKPFDEFNGDEKERFLRVFDYEFAPAGNFGFEKAEITKGGVKTDKIGTNCQSKIVPNLFFIGEVLDVSGMLGGYNIHFAFASAKSAFLGLRNVLVSV